MKKSKNLKGFSLVELLITVVIITVLSVIAYVGINGTNSWFKNEKVKDDLIVLSNAIEHYKRDHYGSYPVPEPGGNMNVLCFNVDASYAHDCDTAAFRQGMIDANLLTKRYLVEVPTDPRTGSRYVYGVSSDGKYFQVAGLVEEDGAYRAETVQNLGLGYFLPSLVRAYDSPNFVTDGSDTNLPYNPDAFVISATLKNATGTIEVDGVEIPSPNGIVVYENQEIEVAGGSVDLYFSDGSITTLDAGGRLKIMETSDVMQNDGDGIITKIYLKLFSGKVWNKVARLASESEFNIETTSAIAGVRGTEFGINAGTGNVTVKSGKVGLRGKELGEMGDFEQDEPIVDLNLTDNEDTVFLATTDISGNPQTYIPNPGGPGTASPALPGEYESYYDNQAIHNGLVPYIVAVDETTAPYTVYVSFNGYTTEEDSYLNLATTNGFEIYTEDKVLGYKKIDTNADPDSIYDIEYDATRKAYSFEYNYTGEPIVIRAFKNDGYSDISWPPQGFSDTPSGEVWEYTDPETHPELALQAYIAGDRNTEAGALLDLKAIVMNVKDEQVDTEYFWTVKNYPEGYLPTESSMNEQVPSIYVGEPGEYTIGLTVANGGETSEESVAVITVGEGVPVTCDYDTSNIYIATPPSSVAIGNIFNWTVSPACAFGSFQFNVSYVDITDSAYSFNVSNYANTSHQPTLEYGHNYELTVEMENGMGTSITSNTVNFDTEVMTPTMINLAVNCTPTEIELSGSATCTATAGYDMLPDVDVTSTCTWSSSNASVVTVSMGYLYGLGLGTSNVTCTEGSMTSDPVTITVTSTAPALDTLCAGADGYFDGTDCWLVAATDTESCDDVCGSGSMTCAYNAANLSDPKNDWTVSSAVCGELDSQAGYSLAGTYDSNFSPVVRYDIQCKNDNNDLRACELPSDDPDSRRICKCEL